MESLRVLQDSLDSSRHPAVPSKKHEKALNSEFKAAALHLTNLYRGSLASSQQSYRAGYVHALKDLLDLVRMRSLQNVNAGEMDEADGYGSAEPGPSRGASQTELRWLIRYLQARVEAMKSDSDEEEGEVEHIQRPQQQSSRQAPVRHRMEEGSQSPAPSTAPGTPAHRFTRMSSSDGVETRTPTRPSSVPSSSSFSFSLPARSGVAMPAFPSDGSGPSSSPLPHSSPSSSSPIPSPQPARRRHRTLSSHATSAVSASSSSPSIATLATVPEESSSTSERMEIGDDAHAHDDEGAREERGMGSNRRGPPVYSRSPPEERPKRRKKTTAEKIALAAAARRHGGSGSGNDGAA